MKKAMVIALALIVAFGAFAEVTADVSGSATFGWGFDFVNGTDVDETASGFSYDSSVDLAVTLDSKSAGGDDDMYGEITVTADVDLLDNVGYDDNDEGTDAVDSYEDNIMFADTSVSAAIVAGALKVTATDDFDFDANFAPRLDADEDGANDVHFNSIMDGWNALSVAYMIEGMGTVTATAATNGNYDTDSEDGYNAEVDDTFFLYGADVDNYDGADEGNMDNEYSFGVQADMAFGAVSVPAAVMMKMEDGTNITAFGAMPSFATDMMTVTAGIDYVDDEASDNFAYDLMAKADVTVMEGLSVMAGFWMITVDSWDDSEMDIKAELAYAAGPLSSTTSFYMENMGEGNGAKSVMTLSEAVTYMVQDGLTAGASFTYEMDGANDDADLDMTADLTMGPAFTGIDNTTIKAAWATEALTDTDHNGDADMGTFTVLATISL